MLTCRRTATVAATFVFALGFSSSLLAETLKQAVEETVDSNPDVLIAAKTRLANTEVYKQARAGYFPRVDVNAGYGRERSKNPSVAARLGKNDYDTLTRKESGVAINQLIFDGFGTPSEVASRRADVQATAYEVAAVAQDLGLEAVNAYLNVLRDQELVSLAKANLSAHRRTYKMIKSRSDSGLNREADVDQATGRLALAKANLQARESNLRDAKIEYLRVVGRAPSDLRYKHVPKISVPAGKEQVVGLALSNHPRLHQAKYDIDQANARYYVARSLFWPRVDAQLGGNWNRNISGSKGTSNDYFAMLRLQYNVFNGGGDVARVREARYLVQRAQEVYHLVERQVAESARLSWNDYHTAKKRLSQLKQHKDSAHKTLVSYRKQFKLNKRSLLDLLDSENELFEASNAYTQEKYTELFSRYRILNSTGTLLQTLGVPLPVEAYDDFAHTSRHRASGSQIKHPSYKGASEDELFLGPVYSDNAAHSQYAANAGQQPQKPSRQFAEHRPSKRVPAQFASAKRQQVARGQKASAQQVAHIQRQQQQAATRFAKARAENAMALAQAQTTSDEAQLWDDEPNVVEPQATVASRSARTKSQGETVAQFTQRFKHAMGNAEATVGKRWNVQVATFSQADNAQRLAMRLREHGYESFIHESKRNGRTLSKVMVAPNGKGDRFAAQETLARLESELQMRGLITTIG